MYDFFFWFVFTSTSELKLTGFLLGFTVFNSIILTV